MSLILGLEVKNNKLVLKKVTMGGMQERLFLASNEVTWVSLENKIYQ